HGGHGLFARRLGAGRPGRADRRLFRPGAAGAEQDGAFGQKGREVDAEMAVSQRTDAEARAAEAHAAEAHAGGAPPITWRDKLQTFRTAAWLGWQAESNWTDPLLFAVYSLVKPLAAAMILVVIYRIVGSETRSEEHTSELQSRENLV